MKKVDKRTKEKNRSVILLRSKSIEIFTKNLTEKLVFVEEIDLEKGISDKEKFSLSLEEFLQEIKLKDQETLILLSDELVYKKDIEIIQPEAAQEEYEKFVSSIPLDKEKIENLRFYKQKLLVALAVNKDIYTMVQKVIEKLNNKVEAIIPVAVMDSSSTVDASLSYKEVQSFLPEEESFSKISFPVIPQAPQGHSESQLTEGLSDNDSSTTKLWVGLGLVVLLLVGLSFVLVKSSFIGINRKVVPTPTLAPAPTQPQRPPTKTKEEIQIEVLNGSGITGQAGKIKTRLQNIGFENITTGNASTVQSGTSVIQFSAEVGEDLRQEIITELEKIVELTLEDGDTGSSDVVIITKK